MNTKNRFLVGVGSVVDLFPGTAKFNVLSARRRSVANAIQHDMKIFGKAIQVAVATEVEESFTAEEKALGFKVRLVPLIPKIAENCENDRNKRATKSNRTIGPGFGFGLGKRKKPSR